jgi:ornithine lipid ester-linked acyl 2-hydroxylase
MEASAKKPLEARKLLRKLNTFIGQQSLIADQTFFDAADFPWVQALEANWQAIRQELEVVLVHREELPNFEDIVVHDYSLTQGVQWKVYLFYAYGNKADKNCERCPETTRLIEAVPGMKTAFFSILQPHKRIPEHRGPYKGVIRYHLGLKIPRQETECGIRVENDVAHWQEGKSLIFDDSFPHEAWNNTDEVRVVLFLDVIRPMRFPVSILNRLMIQIIAWSPYIQSCKSSFRTWDKRLESIFLKKN